MVKNVMLLGTLCLSSQAFAWADLGHAVVGEVAQRNLSPKAKALVYEIIGAEPLGVSATWPDLVRSDSRFKAFAGFHFLEIHYGHTFADRIKAARDGNTIIEQVPPLLVSKKLHHTQKAILLRYLAHLVGDLHQPLHVGNGADMGANLCMIRLKNPKTGDREKFNLHTTWDDKLVDFVKSEFQSSGGDGTAKKYFDYQDLVTSLEKQVADGKIGISTDDAVKSAPEWYAESQALHSVVYPDAKTFDHPRDRDYCKTVVPDPKDPTRTTVVDGAFKESAIPTLDDQYIARALPVIKRQMVLGGLRLAKVLNDLAEKQKNLKPWTPEREKAYLAAILISNPGTDRGPSSVNAADHTSYCTH